AYGASPFARKGGRTRAYRSRRPPPSSPLSAPPHSRGKGAHEGTPPPVPPFPSEGVRTRGPHEGTPPHPTSPRHPRPQFPPSGPRHPGLPHAPRLRTPGDAEGPARPPRSLQRG
ncbi:hypothetical protein EDB85DRAFT_2288042, partial [Lactarius pseudohatsudake]